MGLTVREFGGGGGGGGVVVRAGQLTWVWASQAQVLDLQVVPKGPWGNLFWQQRIAGFRRTFLCRQSGGGGPLCIMARDSTRARAKASVQLWDRD